MKKAQLKQLIKEVIEETLETSTTDSYFKDKKYVLIQGGTKMFISPSVIEKLKTDLKPSADKRILYFPIKAKYTIQGKKGLTYQADVGVVEVQLYPSDTGGKIPVYKVCARSGSFGFGGLQQASRYTMSSKQIQEILKQVQEYIDKKG